MHLVVCQLSLVLTVPTMSKCGWLIKYQDGVNGTQTYKRSPIPVLTGPNVEHLCCLRLVFYQSSPNHQLQYSRDVLTLEYR